jgi:leucyl/phenylalanyl-tRNA--protein transferase
MRILALTAKNVLRFVMSKNPAAYEIPYLNENTRIRFPDPEHSTRDLICTGGNLSPGILLSAYHAGIFPWSNSDTELNWWSPDPRFVIFPQELHVPSRLDRTIKTAEKSGGENHMRFTADSDFKAVITHCSSIPRAGQAGTWITPGMIDAYCEMHRLGYAHSFEVYKNGSLAGGIYGMLLGSVFFGESMFTLEPDAGKAAFVHFARAFYQCGGKLIDSQVYTDNMARFGAKNISRTAFIRIIKKALTEPLTSSLQEHFSDCTIN